MFKDFESFFLYIIGGDILVKWGSEFENLGFGGFYDMGG